MRKKAAPFLVLAKLTIAAINLFESLTFFRPAGHSLNRVVSTSSPALTGIPTMSSKWPLTIATAVLLAGAGLAQPSYAGVVLSDDFAGTAQGNWPGDSVFLSILQPGNVQGLPSVDLVGPGFFANLAYGSGNSVDLDGSTGSGNSPAGELQSI